MHFSSHLVWYQYQDFVEKMLASAGDISSEQVLMIIFGILSVPLALCMLMLSRSFSTPSMLMIMFYIFGYLGCDIVGRLSVSSFIVKTDIN